VGLVLHPVDNILHSRGNISTEKKEKEEKMIRENETPVP
jgi:hypothetical protein